MDLKEIFAKAENGTMTFDQFDAAVKSAGIKLADLSSGNYVSKNKYDTDLGTRDSNIQTLNDTINQRDTDLANLKKQLEDAGADAEKIKGLNTQLASLQSKYDTDMKNYQAQIAKTTSEYAVKDFANSKNFTSNAAKRDFINSMIAKNLTVENGKIIGGEDFTTDYKTENPDAFVTEQTQTSAPENKPKFVSSTDKTSEPTPDPTNGFAKAFNFSSLRGEMPKRQ